jgi:predicted DNA-binding transcriptional regulator AlpA
MLKTRAGQIIRNVPTTSITLIWEPQLCEQLGRSRWTIRRWIASGILPPPIRMHEQGLAWRLRDISCSHLAEAGDQA